MFFIGNFIVKVKCESTIPYHDTSRVRLTLFWTLMAKRKGIIINGKGKKRIKKDNNKQKWVEYSDIM